MSSSIIEETTVDTFREEIVAFIESCYPEAESTPLLFQLTPGIISLLDQSNGDHDVFVDPERFSCDQLVSNPHTGVNALYIPNACFPGIKGLAALVKTLRKYIVNKDTSECPDLTVPEEPLRP